MAELASGAVSSLLGLIRNEAVLLDRAGTDMRFIKEEMESMHSFLEYLARTAPPTGGHDEPVSTWMKQVRDLAHDCSNCIDLYVRRGDHEAYRSRGGRLRFLWWASWLVEKLIARHKAAVRLRDLKERARDVGNRRLRYDVHVPGKEVDGSAKEATVLAQDYDEEEEEEAEEDVQDQLAAVADGTYPLEPRVLEEYYTEKLANWLQAKAKAAGSPIASIAIVAPDDAENAGAIASESLMVTTGFETKIKINLPAVHYQWDRPLLSSEILCYVLFECELQKGTLQAEQDIRQQACEYKNKLTSEMWRTAYWKIDVWDKIEEIKTKIGQVKDWKNLEETKSLKSQIDKRIGVLLHALRLLQEIPDTGLPTSKEEAMQETAQKLKFHMEKGDTKPGICLQVTQYKDILNKVFPPSKTMEQQSQEASTSVTTLGEDHIKEIIQNHKTTLDIILGLLPKQQLLEDTSTKEQATDAAAKIKEDEKKTKEISAAVIKEPNQKMEISEDVIKTKEKLKEISGKVISAIVAAVKEKMKEISPGEVTSAIATAVIKEAKEKLETSGVVEASNFVGAAIKETAEKMYQIVWEIKDQLYIQGIVDKIQAHLKGKKTLIVLQDDEDYVSQWEDMINYLNRLHCAAGSAVIVSTKKSQKAKEFCDPKEEPITCSLVGFYHDKLLKLTQQWEKKFQVLHDILDRCHPHEFCMKIFVDALYANPKRSYEELHKLHEDLISQTTLRGKAKKMLKFSYKDLPREYKTCLLYLAIFPQGHDMRRSTLIGRWVTEGLITKQDWRTAVHHAERCFDALVKQGLVLPCNIGVAGKVKSCMVGDQVHGFITKIANKEHILDARMSDRWARHFSIFSGLRLRASDSIENFVHRLPKYSPQLPLLKVLDLEGTNCFDKNHHLKNICMKILLLKYLSLRNTNVRHLPIEINNLHELEVLDIRQTNKMPEYATRPILLQKLRRFLADRVDPSSRMNDKSHSAVQIPCNIRKMENLEVLSNVKASGNGFELQDISNLWQLRKLGVVIENREDHISGLLQLIMDLKECLQSLSITISSDTKSKSTVSSKEGQQKKNQSLSPKHLESLTINGATEREQLVKLLVQGSNELAKVTLCGTLMRKDDFDVLAVLPELRCLRLRSDAYIGSELIFNNDDFSRLKYFHVEGTNMTEADIKFVDTAAAELEKIILSFTNIRSLCGIDDLPKLKDLELEGNQFLISFSQDKAAPEQNAERRSAEQNNGSTSLNQSTQSRASVQKTESTDGEKNTQTRAAERNSQNTAPEQNAEARDPPQKTTEIRGFEQDNETRASEQNIESKFTFKAGKFKHLKYFRVEHQKMTHIEFEKGTAPELKKITLSLTNKGSQLTGVADLPKLREIELRGDRFLLSLFGNADQITKVTLRDTQLSKADIQILAKKPNLRCLVLTDKSCDESHLAFYEGEFRKLDLLIVECRKINKISFNNGSAPKLKKIVCSFTEVESISGIRELANLKEIEYSGDLVPYRVRKDIAALERKPILTQHQDLAKKEQLTHHIEEGNDDAGFPRIFSFLKNKNRR
ncbi:unnamed protein product [Urochloa humidicola]